MKFSWNKNQYSLTMFIRRVKFKFSHASENSISFLRWWWVAQLFWPFTYHKEPIMSGVTIFGYSLWNWDYWLNITVLLNTRILRRSRVKGNLNLINLISTVEKCWKWKSRNCIGWKSRCRLKIMVGNWVRY